MTNLNSAIEREETPHTTNSTQNNTLNVNPHINIVYRRRAESVIRDRSIDPQSRAVIRYALETNDPWLSELMRRLKLVKAPSTRLISRKNRQQHQRLRTRESRILGRDDLSRW